MQIFDFFQNSSNRVENTTPGVFGVGEHDPAIHFYPTVTLYPPLIGGTGSNMQIFDFFQNSSNRAENTVPGVFGGGEHDPAIHFLKKIKGCRPTVGIR